MTPRTDVLTKIQATTKTRFQTRFQIKGTGRHQAPSQFRKASLRVGAIALATAAAGGIAAVPLTGTLAAPSASVRQPGAQANPGSASPGSRPARTSGARRGRGAPAASRGTAPARPSSRRPAPRKPAVSKPVASKPSAAVLRCSGTGSMLPQNYAAIVAFLTAHGYTKLAAAGMAGNMYQESMGNPESVGTGGGGLIGFTPLPAGYVTGNPAADLHTQLEAVLAYNQQWAQYIPALNAATTATQAADIYMNYFERPGIPAAYNREAAASAVASACGF